MTISVKQTYPTKYIAGEDLAGRTHVLEILRVEVAELKTDPKSEDVDTRILLSLRGAKKKLKLNKTSALVLAAAYGDDAEKWVGQRVMLDIERGKNGQPRRVGKLRSMVVLATSVAGDTSQGERVDKDTGEVLGDANEYDGPPDSYKGAP